MEQEQETPPPTSPTSTKPPFPPPSSYTLFLKIMSKRRTWVFLFVLVYAIILASSWNSLKLILSWYKRQSQPSSASSSGWPALYASVLLGALFGLLSMVAALAVAVPAILVTWITVVVLLAFFGKRKRTLVLEGRKITREIAGFVFKILLKEGNLVAAVCAVLGYFALVRKNSGYLAFPCFHKKLSLCENLREVWSPFKCSIYEVLGQNHLRESVCL
ncbi:uncharacterized protein LOC111309315 isoform X2 [Durio zibethinus]|uniref:Uncharacterized protein LOC111309315 isoform X2 n=1 Tax=Durio zibethinus TaxID=66656 RepID=A0A6P6AGX4_DURZI|nr:uncharacterized protein LOC111309315 isoform X2 [Durio zibethinus]